MQCGKQDHIFEQVAWKPNTDPNTMRTFTQKGIHMIVRYIKSPGFHCVFNWRKFIDEVYS